MLYCKYILLHEQPFYKYMELLKQQYTIRKQGVVNSPFFLLLHLLSKFHTTVPSVGFCSAPSLHTTMTMQPTAKEQIKAKIDIHHPKPILAVAIGDTTVPTAARMLRTKLRSATTEAPTPGLISTRKGITVAVTSMRPRPNKKAPTR